MQLLDSRLFNFLRELAANNERSWFEANKERYEQEVRRPVLAFIEAIEPRLHELSPHVVADARPTGGSLMRIHRDVRFAKDKSPYKTNVGVYFGLGSRKPGDVPGFYLHLAPRDSFVAGGMWHPDRPALSSIRDAIVEHTSQWEAVLAADLDLGGETTKRPPAGYDPQHPHIESLKRKDFVTQVPLTEEDVCGPRFLDTCVGTYRGMVPLMRFLATAQGIPW